MPTWHTKFKGPSRCVNRSLGWTRWAAWRSRFRCRWSGKLTVTLSDRVDFGNHLKQESWVQKWSGSETASAGRIDYVEFAKMMLGWFWRKGRSWSFHGIFEFRFLDETIKQTSKQANKQTSKQGRKQASKQAGRPINRQTYRQTDR